MTQRVRAKGVVALGLALVVTGEANAGEPPRTFSLSWVRLPGAESCIRTQILGAKVERYLGGPVLVSAAQADLSVEGHVERTATAWVALITVLDRGGFVLGTREMRSEELDCKDIGEQVALAVAVMIDPDGVSKKNPSMQRADTKVRDSAPPVSTAAALVSPSGAQRSLEPTSPLRARVQAGAAAGLGLLPRVAFGVAVSGALKPPGFWGLEIHGAAWPIQETSTAPAEGARVALMQAGLSVCPIWFTARSFGLMTCGGAEIGALSAQGFGFDKKEKANELLFDASLTTRGSYVIVGPLAAAVGFRLGAPLRRYRLFARDGEGAEIEVFRASPVIGSVDLGFAVELP